MLCVVIDRDLSHIQRVPSYADLIELRLDRLRPHTIEPLKRPCIVTVKHPEEALQWTHLQPAYFDIPEGSSPAFIAALRHKAPLAQIILSYHNFEGVPQDIDAVYNALRAVKTDVYKIAVFPHSTTEALRFALWAKQQSPALIAVAMGPYGQWSRILSPFTYACIDSLHPSAPGQLSAEILHTRYRYGHITAQTRLYGLIGDPVDLSISDITHNAFFQRSDLNALYLKMQLAAGELSQGLPLLHAMGFQGLSVTRPLKEKILPFLDAIDPEARAIGAVNTLVCTQNQWVGFNTDGQGALDAMGPVWGQRIALMGAGGAAKAIAHEAHKRGAFLICINRDRSQAQSLAKRYGASFLGLDERARCAEYDILINTTAADLDPEWILPGTRVMDIRTRPRWTRFLQAAAEKHCSIIHGEEMFFRQAHLQFQLWGLARADEAPFKDQSLVLEESASGCAFS